MEGARTSDFVLLIGTESLLKKHKRGVSAVCNELIQINRGRTEDRDVGKYHVLPLLLSGDYGTSFPPYYELYTNIEDWRANKDYLQHLRWLLPILYGLNEN